jgi:hypothetical protein
MVSLVALSDGFGNFADCGVDQVALLQVPLDDGSGEFVLVEIGSEELAGSLDEVVVLASADGSRFKATGFTLASAMDGVMPALQVILGKLRHGLHSPDEITMKLGLQIGGEAGVFLAKGTTKASVEVAVTWSRASGAPTGVAEVADRNGESAAG